MIRQIHAPTPRMTRMLSYCHHDVILARMPAILVAKHSQKGHSVPHIAARNDNRSRLFLEWSRIGLPPWCQQAYTRKRLQQPPPVDFAILPTGPLHGFICSSSPSFSSLAAFSRLSSACNRCIFLAKVPQILSPAPVMRHQSCRN